VKRNKKLEKQTLKILKRSLKKQLFLLEMTSTSRLLVKKKARKKFQPLKSRFGCWMGQEKINQSCG